MSEIPPQPGAGSPDQIAYYLRQVAATMISGAGSQPSGSESLQAGNVEGPQAPAFATIHKNQPHMVARTGINTALRQFARQERGIVDLQRAAVPPEKVSWDVAFPEYDPPYVDIPGVYKDDDAADPLDAKQIPSFYSLEVSEVKRDTAGRPLNPMGRTGLQGRGILNKWGATQAADPVVTRINPETGTLEALLIQRGDTGEWALPGGKVDTGELPWQAAGRELSEEASARNVTLDFSQAHTVYAGYVDDSRNTDNAWMETTALHLHLTPEQSRTVVIEAGSDAAAASWVPVQEELYDSLFASHGSYLRLAVERQRTQ